MSRFISLVLICLCLAACAPGTLPTLSAQACFEESGQRFDEIVNCYRQEQAAQPLTYSKKIVTQIDGGQQWRYQLTSQHWSPEHLVQPDAWTHDVVITIPDHALSERAVIIANNGINNAANPSMLKPASDFSADMAATLAKQTRTIVVSVSDVPNQYLTYLDDAVARREDSSVAHSWNLFMQAPQTRAFNSLHVPMMETVVKAMDLAERELQPWRIHHFIATGASKRAWAIWLAALVDTRIEAIAPLVLDILNMNSVLTHTYAVYGGNWPYAFGDYVREGVIAQRGSPQFANLIRIEDPWEYLQSAYAHRLTIPKYIINASGDDFFVPDNSQFYFDRLPGVKAMRVAPNTSHAGILNYAQTSLATMVNRMQKGRELPAVVTQVVEKNAGGQIVNIRFSEPPVKLVQWLAVNPLARDFRYACGIRYQANALTPTQTLSVAMASPQQGWSATFVEAEFADGFVLTTPVRVLPDNYPTSAPPETTAGCKTL